MAMTWNASADIELLAWLDFCKENKFEFGKTIVRHLSHAGSEVCKADVENRLFVLRCEEAENTYGEQLRNGGILRLIICLFGKNFEGKAAQSSSTYLRICEGESGSG